eukprot:TRINITY_DN13575_c0_g1_i1.p1 TRINITY_DN13575_c0_g1~~TRINITY_DN13575_c0_g1_i1.p1  ORF type:complete len:296 (+),score=59.32 TRINITY_DN13575_c0_g1_i1:77-889(+)
MNTTGNPGVLHLLAVASGKGGVGKSTVAVNVALGLAAQNLRVGLLDADVYGPSAPKLLQLSGMPLVSETSKKFIPLQNYGLKVMSMGFLVQEDSPIIWRGLMVMSALEQLLYKVEWGDLDVLVIDLPPGTGDTHLSLCQRAPLSGALIVSTPQDLALIDARRGANMFKKLNVPLLGLVENMSYYRCTNCGTKAHLFGEEGAKKTAEDMDIEFLAGIPLTLKLRETSDEGKPLTICDPDSDEAKIFKKIAARLWEKLQLIPSRRKPIAPQS